MDGIDQTNVTQNLAVLDSLGVKFGKVLIEFGQLGHELVRGEATEHLGNNVLDLDSLLGQIQSCNTSQDDHLAGHVHAVQVIARIRFLFFFCGRYRDTCGDNKTLKNRLSVTTPGLQNVLFFLADIEKLKKV